MSVHTVLSDPGIYFITFTCYQWLPIIELSNGYDAVYNFFGMLRNQGNSIAAYVIMPNHLHFILNYNGKGKDLITVIGNGKRFMAYDMVRKMEANGNHDMLNYLKRAVSPNSLKKGQKHCIWINSFDVKECRTEKFLLQKLQYIHNNPVVGKWKLALEPQDYLHSSALFYYNGKQRKFDVVDYRASTTGLPLQTLRTKQITSGDPST